METIILGILVILIIRGIDLYFFLKRVSKRCYRYDWRHVDHNDELLIDMFSDDDYTMTREWSAYNFLFYKGPSPLEMFLSFKPLRIKEQYNIDAVKRLNQYETI